MLERKKIDSNLHEKEEKISYGKKKVDKFNVGSHFSTNVTFSKSEKLVKYLQKIRRITYPTMMMKNEENLVWN